MIWYDIISYNIRSFYHYIISCYGILSVSTPYVYAFTYHMQKEHQVVKTDVSVSMIQSSRVQSSQELLQETQKLCSWSCLLSGWLWLFENQNYGWNATKGPKSPIPLKYPNFIPFCLWKKNGCWVEVATKLEGLRIHPILTFDHVQAL